MSNKKPVAKTEVYNLRLKASEKLLIQQAAQAAGLGTAEYFSNVLQAVSYAVLKYEESKWHSSRKSTREIDRSQVASSYLAWPGARARAERKARA